MFKLTETVFQFVILRNSFLEVFINEVSLQIVLALLESFFHGLFLKLTQAWFVELFLKPEDIPVNFIGVSCFH